MTDAEHLSFDEAKAAFEQSQRRGFDADLSMPQVLRIRSGFETATPLHPRGDQIPAPDGERRDMDAISAAFDDEGAGSDGFDRIHQAEIDYREVCENLTGNIIPDEAVAELRERRRLQDAKTVALAKALESREPPPALVARCSDCRLALRPPVPFYHGENWEGRCTVIGVFSGEVLPLPPVRRVAFLPSIAAGQRSKMLRDVEYFLGQYPMTARMFTITNGPRVPIHPIVLREEVKGFHRWLSKMAANKSFKAFGLRMQWRATEFGEPKWDEDSGQMTLHLHAHCLVTEPAGISKKRRAKLRKKLWKVFGVHWDDGGTIENAREFVKYPVKDSDLETIQAKGGSGALADFYEAVRGLHIIQPMGELRADRSKRRHAGKRIDRVNGPDGRYLIERYDQNAVKRPFTAPGTARNRYLMRALWETMKGVIIQTARIKRGGYWAESCGSEAESGAESGGLEAESGGMGAESGRKEPPRIANRIIARLSPAPYGGAVCEPGVVVWGFDGNMLAVFRQPAVARLRAQHRAAYAAACDAQALTRALTHAHGRAPRAAGEGSQRSNNCPRAAWPPPPSLGDLALADAENDRN